MQYRGFDPSFRLDGKVAIVTGATRGIGKNIARFLCERGACVAITGTSDKVHEAADALCGAGHEALGIIADFFSENAAEGVVRETVARFGRIDILVNNAAITRLEKAEEFPDAYWDEMLQVNLKAPFQMCQQAARVMIAAGNGGRIINITSKASEFTVKDHVSYCSVKAALKQLTRSLAIELGAYGITVNSIGPGVVLTDMGRLFWGDGSAFGRTVAMGRPVEADEVSAAVAFFASDAAGTISGVNLLVDSGPEKHRPVDLDAV